MKVNFFEGEEGGYGFLIDNELSDKITTANLKNYRNTLVDSLESHRKNNTWLHPEDVPQMEKSIDAIETILRNYGEYD